MSWFDDYFESNDDKLHRTGEGQDRLDYWSTFPLLGEGCSAAQALYHGAHAVHDLSKGDYRGATEQAYETAYDGVNAIPAVHEANEPSHVTELGYDVAADKSRQDGYQTDNYVEHNARTFADNFYGHESDEDRDSREHGADIDLLKRQEEEERAKQAAPAADASSGSSSVVGSLVSGASSLFHALF
jgi:hypothetical protein